jgi:hypothetical protein
VVAAEVGVELAALLVPAGPLAVVVAAELPQQALTRM